MGRTATKERTTAADEASLFQPPPEAPPAGRNAVAKRTPRKADASLPARAEPAQERVVPMTGLAEILGVFERLAINPNVNPDSLDKLLSVQERLLDRNAKIAFNQAFVAMTAVLPLIPKKGRIVIREKDAQSGRRSGEVQQDTPYPKWETTGERIKPTLERFGFGLQHRIGTVIEGTERRVRVIAVLRHVGGHIDDSCYFDLLADTTGSKNNNQGWASSVTYAKRHTAFAVLGLIAEGDDDDAKASGKPVMVGDPMTEEELARVREFAEAVECPEDKLVVHMNSDKVRPRGHPKADKLADIPRSRYEEALDHLRGWEAERKRRADEAAQKRTSGQK